MVQNEQLILSDRKTPRHKAEFDGFIPDVLMSGAKSKALSIRQRTGLSDSTTLLVDYGQETSDFRQLAITV